MNAQTPIEPYRVILDYEALEDMFLDRIEDLNTTFLQIDFAAGFTPGNTQKLLSKSRERWARTLGIESMGKMLKGTGMALVAVVMNEAIRAELTARQRPRKPAIAGIARPAWLFSKKKAREMGKKRFSLMTPAQRKRHQRKAAKARWKRRPPIIVPDAIVSAPAPGATASQAPHFDCALPGYPAPNAEPVAAKHQPGARPRTAKQGLGSIS
jgi:hypothetical protein